MATNIETLKKPNGDYVLPRTCATAVSLDSGTTVEQAIVDLQQQKDELNTLFNIISKEIDGKIEQSNEYTDARIAEIENMIDNSADGVQPDWNQNDETAADYIKNRPFYYTDSLKEIIATTTADFEIERSDYTSYTYIIDKPPQLLPGRQYMFDIDGTQYTAMASEYRESGAHCITIGNNVDGYPSMNYIESKYPFCVARISTNSYVIMIINVKRTNSSYQEFVSHTFSLYEIVDDNTKKIDPHFLPTGGVGYIDKHECQLTYTFDGNQNSGLDAFMVDGDDTLDYYFVKISNDVPTMESLVGGTFSMYNDGEVDTTEITESMMLDMHPHGLPAYAVCDVLLVIEEQVYDSGVLLSAGTWAFLAYSHQEGGLLYLSELSYYGTDDLICKIDGKFLYQPDWSQNDETAPDYVKNRPFYDAGVRSDTIELMAATTMDFDEQIDSYYGKIISPPAFKLIPGQTYEVNFDGVAYLLEAKIAPGYNDGYVYIGNGSKHSELFDSHDCNFCISYLNILEYGAYLLMFTAETCVSDSGVSAVPPTHTISISKIASCNEVKKVDPKFLPDGGFGYTTEHAVSLIDNQLTQRLTKGWSLSKEIDVDNCWNPELVLGVEYTVTVNGTEYKSVAKMFGDKYIYLGDVREKDYLDFGINASDVTNVDHTGEPWCVIYNPGIDTIFVMFDGTEEAMLSIVYEGMVDVAIDPRYLPKGGFGFTANDVQNVIIDFDGVIGDKENFSFASYVQAVKISDVVPTLDDLIGGTVTVVVMNQGEITFSITEENVGDVDDDIPAIMIAVPGTELFALVVFDDFDRDGYYLTKGLWCMSLIEATAPGEGIAWRFEYQHTTEQINQIEDQYIPDTIARISDVEKMIGNVQALITGAIGSSY